MSVISSSAAYLSSAMRDNSPEHESFKKFFECWLSKQNQQLQDLTFTVKSFSSTPVDEGALRSLIERVINHYECYYRTKATWSRLDVCAMLHPSWLSSLEDAFLWIGGWRPSMAFHLLYSKSGLQLEAPGKLDELIRSMTTTTGRDLADITPEQLSRVDELQRRTIRQEREISEEIARCQETLAGPDMIELSNMVSEQSVNNDSIIDDVEEEDRVESALKPKEKGLEEVLNRADKLRLKTLKDLIDLLTPIQAVHFLIAAAQLHLKIHEWGKRRDAKHHLAA